MENRDDVNKWGGGGMTKKKSRQYREKKKIFLNTYKYYPQIKVKILHLLYKKRLLK